MRKIIIILLTLCSLFVSCASTSGAEKEVRAMTFNTENSIIMADSLYLKDNAKLREKFYDFNAKFFDNKLQINYIGYTSFNNLVSKDGNMYYTGLMLYDNNNGIKNYGIVLLNDRSLYNCTFEGILLHEMVHLYFFQKGQLYENHGKNFCKKVDEINKKSNNKYHVIYE